MKKALLSILIPTYNNIEGIQNILNCLYEIDLKTSEFIEVFISDDSEKSLISESNIKNLEEKFLYFHYIHNKPKLGSVKNMNQLIDLAKGDYFWVLHHDEYWLNKNTILKIIIEDLKKNKDIYFLPIKKVKNIILGDFIIDFSQKHSHYKYFHNMVMKNPHILLKTNIFGPPSSLIISKKFKYKYNEKLKFLLDIEYYIKIFKRIDKNKTFIFKNKQLEILSSQNNKVSVTKSLGFRKTIIQKKEKLILEKRFRVKKSLFTSIEDNIFYVLFKLSTLISIRFRIKKRST
jgi:glycosyltransferase involved in cell wall biosynthesis